MNAEKTSLLLLSVLWFADVHAAAQVNWDQDPGKDLTALVAQEVTPAAPVARPVAQVTYLGSPTDAPLGYFAPDYSNDGGSSAGLIAVPCDSNGYIGNPTDAPPLPGGCNMYQSQVNPPHKLQGDGKQWGATLTIENGQVGAIASNCPSRGSDDQIVTDCEESVFFAFPQLTYDPKTRDIFANGVKVGHSNKILGTNTKNGYELVTDIVTDKQGNESVRVQIVHGKKKHKH